MRYLQEFTASGNTPFENFGWSAYLSADDSSVVDWSDAGSEPAFIASGNYAFFAPGRNADFNDADGPGLLFTTEPEPFHIGDLLSLSLDETMDGSAGDPALGRFAVRIGEQWYASTFSFSSTTNNGPGGASTEVSLSGISFSDGRNWQRLDVALGGPGEGILRLDQSTIGGTLDGAVTGVGVYAEPGNNGDHFRIDNFEVSTRPVVRAVEDALEVSIGGALSFDPTDNDTGPVDTSTLLLVSAPSQGTVEWDPSSGHLIYKHEGALAGSDSFRYRIGDAAASMTSEAEVKVTVNGALRLENQTVNIPLNPPQAGSGELAMEVGLPDLTFPQAVAMSSVPGAPEALLVASINGAVWYVPDTTSPSPTKHKVLEITDALSNPSSNGRRILSITCYPDFATSGNIILNYQGDQSRLPPVAHIPNLDRNGNPNTTILNELRVSRFTLSAAHIADVVANGMSTAENNAVLHTEFPFINMAEQNQIHSINDCKFGPDGYLYLSFGDEGGQPDPHRNGQTITKDYYSSILRIDVDPASTHPKPNPHYTIPAGPLSGGKFPIFSNAATQNPNFRVPADNPFIHTTLGGNWDGDMNGTDYSSRLSSVRTEIWALGLRNPFKFHLDTEDGTPDGEVEAWIGDIGYNDREEVNRFTKGDNGGWSYFEGELPGATTHASIPAGSTPHQTALFTYETGSSTGNSVIGGIFYRETALSELTDTYVFGDYGSGRIWSLTRSGEVSELSSLQLGGTSIVDFELDRASGDIFVLEHGPSARVMRMTKQTGGPSSYPETLSATGLFADLTDLSPNTGVIPYTPNLTFWSDGADKSRWFVIKNTSDTIGYSQDGNWDFPEGMIWVKHFDFDLDQQNPGTHVKRLETRVLVRNDHGSYGVSYRWRMDGSEADLVDNTGDRIPIDFIDETGSSQNFIWNIPSRAECTTCHTPDAGHALSMNSRQFNLEQMIHGQSGNLLELLSAGGYLRNFSGRADGLPRHHRPEESDVDLETRVRSYLAVNCGYCHMEGGSAPPSFDARAHLTIHDTGLLYGQPMSEGTPDESDHIIRPGDKPNSSIWNKINARAAINGSFNGYSQMPPIGTNRFDTVGIALLAEWIDNHANLAPTPAEGSPNGARVSENAAVGEIIAQANAEDPDVRNGISDQSQLRYSMVSGNDAGLFTLDPLTGRLTLNGWLDFERNPHHVLQIEVSDNFGPNEGVLTRTLVIELIDETSPDLTEDLDANGIFDHWEKSFGVTRPDEDEDKDGIPAIFEFLSGGDPRVPDSSLSLAVQPVDPTSPNQIELSWNIRNGFLLDLDYLIHQSANLVSWSPLNQGADYEVISVSPIGTGVSRIVVRVPKNSASSFLNLSAP
ncbi:cadherin domain-containing protein [Haloferula chungangensis]|uniref:Cadherin domain-containing protein n=1 Tax=Haloferula chungangensis TaxID=1048331 RepID=A0ABW2L348_9BACT